jgi:hypothetical protein
MTELDTTAGRRLLDAIGKATTGTDRLAALSSFRQWAAANAEARLAAAEERDRLREALESALERETAMNPCACPICVEWRDQARAALSPSTTPSR